MVTNSLIGGLLLGATMLVACRWFKAPRRAYKGVGGALVIGYLLICGLLKVTPLGATVSLFEITVTIWTTWLVVMLAATFVENEGTPAKQEETKKEE
jgi:hypothetical protein